MTYIRIDSSEEYDKFQQEVRRLEIRGSWAYLAYPDRKFYVVISNSEKEWTVTDEFPEGKTILSVEGWIEMKYKDIQTSNVPCEYQSLKS